MSGLELRYFILKPAGPSEHAKASRLAMVAYARSIQFTQPELAADINEWITSVATSRKELHDLGLVAMDDSELDQWGPSA